MDCGNLENRRIHAHAKHTRLFPKGAPFEIANDCQQPKCPPEGNCLEQVWYMKYYASTKKDEKELYVVTEIARDTVRQKAPMLLCYILCEIKTGTARHAHTSTHGHIGKH